MLHSHHITMPSPVSLHIYFAIFTLHSGQYHLPVGSFVSPTQPQWNHSRLHPGLSQATIFPQLTALHVQYSFLSSSSSSSTSPIISTSPSLSSCRPLCSLPPEPSPSDNALSSPVSLSDDLMPASPLRPPLRCALIFLLGGARCVLLGFFSPARPGPALPERAEAAGVPAFGVPALGPVED